MVIALMGLTSSRDGTVSTRYQPEPNPVQPIFLTTDPTQPSPQSVPLPCRISTDALLRIRRNTAKRIWRVTGKLLRIL